MPYDNYIDRSLSKDEILRGYDSFKNVFIRSKVIDTGCLKCYIQFNNNSASPQSNKVGFTVSKKKVRKAFVRNRIKRLLKEAYRNEKHHLKVKKNLIMIFTFSDSKSGSVDLLYKNGFSLFSNDFRKLFEQINSSYSAS